MNFKIKRRFNADSALVIVVLIVSIINLYLYREDLFQLSPLISIIGLLGVVMFLFSKSKIFFWPLYIWIYAQFFIFKIYNSDGVSTSLNWDMVQFYKFGASSLIDHVHIEFNYIPFIYLWLLKVLRMSELEGIKLKFRLFREGELSPYLPRTGTIVKRVSVDDDKKWLLVDLDEPMDYDGDTIVQVLITNKVKGDRIRLKDNKQIIQFRIVPPDKAVYHEVNFSNDYPFLDWAYCSK